MRLFLFVLIQGKAEEPSSGTIQVRRGGNLWRFMTRAALELGTEIGQRSKDRKALETEGGQKAKSQNPNNRWDQRLEY